MFCHKQDSFLCVTGGLILMLAGLPHLMEIRKHAVKVVKKPFWRILSKKEKNFYVTCQKQCIITFVTEYTMGMERRSTFTKCLHKKVPINKCALTS